MREATFAKKYERWFHLFIIFWSVSTSIVGLALGVFFPADLGPGCWVSSTPGGCSSFGCKAEMIAWIFGGIPTMIVLLAIVGNNLILYCHVRATVIRGQKRAMENEKRLSMYNMDESQQLDMEPSDNATTKNHRPWKVPARAEEEEEEVSSSHPISNGNAFEPWALNHFYTWEPTCCRLDGPWRNKFWMAEDLSKSLDRASSFYLC
jgi:hypothetical protein